MMFLKLPDGRVAVGMGTPVWHRHRPNQPSFYAPDFFLSEEKPWVTFPETRLLSTVEWREFRKAAPAADPIRVHFEALEAGPFMARVTSLLENIGSGRLKKAVPIVFETAAANAFAWSGCLARLKVPSELFEYGFEDGMEAMIGASPEILFHLHGRELTTMALAGTAEAWAASLLENSKEMLEHQLVVDDLYARMSAFGAVRTGETVEHVLPGLKHLLTPLHLSSNRELDVEAVTRAVHPTPALGGYPREAAMEWLRKQPEAAVRRRFGAPFGFADGEFAFMIVAIRNVQKHSGRWWLGSGCGVVSGSKPEHEWAELTLKRDSVCRALGIER